MTYERLFTAAAAAFLAKRISQEECDGICDCFAERQRDDYMAQETFEDLAHMGSSEREVHLWAAVGENEADPQLVEIKHLLETLANCYAADVPVFVSHPTHGVFSIRGVRAPKPEEVACPPGCLVLQIADEEVPE